MADLRDVALIREMLVLSSCCTEPSTQTDIKLCYLDIEETIREETDVTTHPPVVVFTLFGRVQQMPVVECN